MTYSLQCRGITRPCLRGYTYEHYNNTQLTYTIQILVGYSTHPIRVGCTYVQKKRDTVCRVTEHPTWWPAISPTQGPQKINSPSTGQDYLNYEHITSSYSPTRAQYNIVKLYCMYRGGLGSYFPLPTPPSTYPTRKLVGSEQCYRGAS